jgi:hypothetical protein
MPGIQVSELTTGSKNGTGVFDQLMSTIDIRLADEFSNDRIKGTEYAKVYLGSMEAAITQGIQFLLGGALLVAQEAKINAEIGLINSQRDKIASEILLIAQQIENAKLQESLIAAQIVKMQAEGELIGQKVLTEQAQILDTVQGSSVTGMIGKQKDLLQAQRDGFARKAEQDLSKILSDSWSVRRTTDEGTIAPNGLKDDDITAVLEKAKTGIGL